MKHETSNDLAIAGGKTTHRLLRPRAIEPAVSSARSALQASMSDWAQANQELGQPPPAEAHAAIRQLMTEFAMILALICQPIPRQTSCCRP